MQVYIGTDWTPRETADDDRPDPRDAEIARLRAELAAEREKAEKWEEIATGYEQLYSTEKARAGLESDCLRSLAAQPVIKGTWGGDRPRVVFLVDGTKISIERDGQVAWLKIGKAAIITAREAEGAREGEGE